MNLMLSVEAYKSFYSQGVTAYKKGDIITAKVLLKKASAQAKFIAKNGLTQNVKTEYKRIANEIDKMIDDFDAVKINEEKTIKNKKSETKKDTFQPISDNENKITFKDVAGLDEVKDEITYKILKPISNPELAEKYKINVGGKILLYGPPGTGKTFIARAIAGEVDAKFYSVNCQDLISKYMGESSKQLDSLFESALKNEKAIIFFDEIDSLGSKRGGDAGGVDGEMSRFVATFLTKVDGFKKSKTNKMLLLMGATNRPWALDTALIRGGRFDTHIYIGVPDLEARKFMVDKAFKGVPLASDFSSLALARKLKGFGGGDVVSICDKIRLNVYKRAVKTEKQETITIKDCTDVLNKQRNVITDEELEKFERFKRGEKVE